VTGLVQRREQRVAKIVLVNACSDADVASGKPTAERVVGEVEPAALEIVAQTLRNMKGRAKARRSPGSMESEPVSVIE
jgi:hypothetical protein